MVVAEVPLWVVHPGGVKNNTIKNATVENDHNTGLAKQSLSLLDTGGGGKCAIYCVDIHPQGTKFATGGGDGTVRLWNSSFLFSKNRGRYGAEAAFESSDSSSSDVGEDSLSNAEDNIVAPEDSNSEDSPTDVVHDLSKLVRRKKDGSSPVKLPPPSIDAKKAISSPSTKQHRLSSSHHRLLCTLSAHTGSSVLAVRFSTGGHFLASAGDDAVVCIYAPSKSPAAIGNLTENAVENWSRIKLCRGHTLDVVGLAWAPDDSHLVSCSLDSDAPIIVWKLTDLASSEGDAYRKGNVLCNPYKTLGKNIHTSTVKGVTFDPAGTYLASSGDDPAVCIWRAHDDWGLERRVGATSGIFRSWKKGEEDFRELSSQTLFRRLSWSTDGAYICSTNATVKNKHVASTISREGWNVSSSKSAASGAANLVGHKQPVVASRHSPVLLDARKSSTIENVNDDDDDEPEYGTLLALGDKKGFVTVWSTRKSRPIFKLQCSESKSTVTDLAWGRRQGGDMILLVSLLDGHTVALRFGIPSELGPVLTNRDQGRVFQLRYGIDLDDTNGLGRRRMFVGDNSAPKLIENALQFSLEEEQEAADEENGNNSSALPTYDQQRAVNIPQQLESRSKVTGKKRIRPVLMSVGNEDDSKRAKTSLQNGIPNNLESKDQGNKDLARREKSKTDLIKDAKDAMESATKVASLAEGIAATSAKRTVQEPQQQTEKAVLQSSDSKLGQSHVQIGTGNEGHIRSAKIPHSTNKIYSIDLPIYGTRQSSLNIDSDGESSSTVIAECTNSFQLPAGSLGNSLPCSTLSISRNGSRLWKDDIIGTSCTSIAAASLFLAVGTKDGCIYLYGTSPTEGWKSGMGFRSHPPLVVGNSVVTLQLREGGPSKADESIEKNSCLEMLVVTADGTFGVYNLFPELKVNYKGSILPAMTHMGLSSSPDAGLPCLARVQITETSRLLLTLSSGTKAPRSISDDNTRGSARVVGSIPPVGVGGSLQSFIYNRPLELWTRISDSRFILSDFYSTLPAGRRGVQGVLSKMDDVVRSGSSLSSMKPSRRGRNLSNATNASTMYHSTDESTVTRSHCEDRMACALALGSAEEFQHWLSLFIRVLSLGGHDHHLRFVVDLLLGISREDNNEASNEESSFSCWWLSTADQVLNLDKKELIRKVVIPEMSKNRALQRITNEISMDLD